MSCLEDNRQSLRQTNTTIDDYSLTEQDLTGDRNALCLRLVLQLVLMHD